MGEQRAKRGEGRKKAGIEGENKGDESHTITSLLPIFRNASNGVVRTTIRFAIKGLVILHSEGHITDLTLKAPLMPNFPQNIQLFDRIDGLTAPGALLCFTKHLNEG